MFNKFFAKVRFCVWVLLSRKYKTFPSIYTVNKTARRNQQNQVEIIMEISVDNFNNKKKNLNIPEKIAIIVFSMCKK